MIAIPYIDRFFIQMYFYVIYVWLYAQMTK